jgi:hydrogenase maturation protease
MRTLVLGLGNPILSDDGVGIRVAHEVAIRVNDPQVNVTESSGAGLSLLDSIAGYDRLIIVDAIQTKEGDAGQIYRLGLEDLSLTRYFSSPHQINLATALELGRMLGLAMPQRVIIFAVEAKDVTTFGEKCTPEVEQVIAEVVRMVLEELTQRYNR